jgi:hypothetical protein
MISEKKTTVISPLPHHKVAAMNVGESCQKKTPRDSNKHVRINKNMLQSSRLIEHWKSLFEITDWDINCEPISAMQVVDALKGNTPGHEFVGISINFEKRKGTIFHTRELNEDDIIHELLHVRFPTWSENEVNFWMDLLINQAKSKMAINSDVLVIV